MNKREVVFGTYRVVVGEATAKAGMIRSVLAANALEEENALGTPGTIEASARRIMHIVLYPALVAAVVEHSGFDKWPLDFNEFCELPESFVIEWEEATYALNPHWLPRNQEAKKKE